MNLQSTRIAAQLFMNQASYMTVFRLLITGITGSDMCMQRRVLCERPCGGGNNQAYRKLALYPIWNFLSGFVPGLSERNIPPAPRLSQKSEGFFYGAWTLKIVCGQAKDA
jgi:hypothetical protein